MDNETENLNENRNQNNMPITLKWLNEETDFNRLYCSEFHQESIKIILESEKGNGFGEILSFDGQRNIFHTLQAVSEEIGENPQALEKNISNIAHLLGERRNVLAGIDLAFHDLWAKANGRPLFELLGLDDMELPSSAAALALRDRDEIEKAVGTLKKWPVIKLELGWEYDIRAVQEVSNNYKGDIWVNVEGRWSRDEAYEKMGLLEKYGVELAIQPVSNADILVLRKLKENYSVKIFAEINSAKDLPRISYAVDGIAINPLKVGGIKEVIKAVNASRAFDLDILITAGKTGIYNIAACAQIAAMADYLDLGAWLWLPEDKRDGLVIENGEVSLGRLPGLGIPLLE